MKIKRSELESLKDFLYNQTQAFESDLAEAQSTAQRLPRVKRCVVMSRLRLTMS